MTAACTGTWHPHVRGSQRILTTTCCPAGVLYLLDVLFSFHIGFVLTKSMHARLVLDGRLVAKLYVRHSTFVLDILAALPLPLEVRQLPVRHGCDDTQKLHQEHATAASVACCKT